MPNLHWKYNEENVIHNFMSYLNETYSEHYTNDENDLQVFDVWKARGTMTDTAIDTAVKYLVRYGRKNGHDLQDLYKAMHYIVLAIGNDENWEEDMDNRVTAWNESVKKSENRITNIPSLATKVANDALDVYNKAVHRAEESDSNKLEKYEELRDNKLKFEMKGP